MKNQKSEIRSQLERPSAKTSFWKSDFQKTEARFSEKRLYSLSSVLCPLFSMFCVLSSVICLVPAAYAFDVKGLQPLSPYGVFSTFSAESLKRNSLGLSVSVEKSVEPNFYRTVLNLAYGLHEKIEFNLTLPYVFEWEDKIDGFEDLSIALKHRFVDETTYSPAFAYLITLSIPSGREEFSTDGSKGIGAIITKKIGPFKGHLNVFYSKPEKSELKDEYTVNIGLESAISHNSKILAEVVGKKNYFKNKIDLFEWRLGYRIATTEYIYTTVGAGFDFKNRSPDYRLIFSVSYILPPKHR